MNNIYAVRACVFSLFLYIIFPIFSYANESASPAGVQPDTICVSDFGAVPGDGKCDLQAIKKAISEAVKTGARRLVFDKGTYDIFVEDAEKFAFVIKGAKNLSVEGAASAGGTPLTKIVRHYKMAVDIDARAIFQVSECENFRLKNLIFDNYPRYFTAGEIIENNGKELLVKIFDGNPLGDGRITVLTQEKQETPDPDEDLTPSPTPGGDDNDGQQGGSDQDQNAGQKPGQNGNAGGSNTGTNGGKGGSVNTGDPTDMYGLFAVMAVAAGAAGCAIYYIQRQRKHGDN